MKKILLGTLALSLTVATLIGGSGCGLFGSNITAYELAVKNGFKGTEQEWLDSLHGANGEDGKDLTALDLYETAVAEGFTGTFLDFCKTLGITMPSANDTNQIHENMMSVVSIYCGYSVTSGSGYMAQRTYGTQVGSGVIIDLNKEAGNALIITNYHVVYNQESDANGILDNIWVYLYGGRNGFTAINGDVGGDGMQATYVGGAMDYDVAVLKVEGCEYLKTSNATEAVLGNSDDLTVGEKTFVVGNPAGAGISVTNGILSVDSEYVRIDALDNRDEDHDGEVDKVRFRVARTSAAINGGNSGGGMFDTSGRLVGIVNAKNAGSTTDNMGYALPINLVKAVVDNILNNGGSVKRAMLGIEVVIKSSQAVLGSDGNVDIKETFCIKQVTGAPAMGKLQVNDIIVAGRINDGATFTFTRQYQLLDFLLQARLGDTVHLDICDNDNELRTVSIPLNSAKYFVEYS